MRGGVLVTTGRRLGRYHDADLSRRGTGQGAEAVGVTALGTAVESERAATKSSRRRTSCVASFDQLPASGRSQRRTGQRGYAATLWDRSVFRAINVATANSISYLYLYGDLRWGFAQLSRGHREARCGRAPTSRSSYSLDTEQWGGSRPMWLSGYTT